MEFLSSTELTVPLVEIVMLLSLSTMFLLFSRMKLALLTNYLFTLYWGFLFNQDSLLGLVKGSNVFIILYFGFGLSIAACAVFGFLSAGRKQPALYETLEALLKSEHRLEEKEPVDESLNERTPTDQRLDESVTEKPKRLFAISAESPVK